jgi:hypothetical protein
MASYRKYVMMGVSTILLPLAKKALSKVMRRYTEESEHNASAEENEAFTHTRRASAKRA